MLLSQSYRNWAYLHFSQNLMKLYKYKIKNKKKVTHSKSEGSIVESDNAGKKLNGIIGDLFGFIS